MVNNELCFVCLFERIFILSQSSVVLQFNGGYAIQHGHYEAKHFTAYIRAVLLQVTSLQLSPTLLIN